MIIYCIHCPEKIRKFFASPFCLTAIRQATNDIFCRCLITKICWCMVPNAGTYKFGGFVISTLRPFRTVVEFISSMIITPLFGLKPLLLLVFIIPPLKPGVFDTILFNIDYSVRTMNRFFLSQINSISPGFSPVQNADLCTITGFSRKCTSDISDNPGT